MSFAEGYIDVATRIAEFREKYPNGSLQPADLAAPFTVADIGGKQRIVVVAAAYRTPDDTRPGIGMAFEEVPGKTPYTRDSELQNAETSAWGRAIVAVLAADTKKGVASADDVRNRQADEEARKAERLRTTPPDDPWQTPAVTDAKWAAHLRERVEACDALPVLKGLYSELTSEVKAGHVADTDATDLRALLEQRAEELKAAEKAAEQVPA